MKQTEIRHSITSCLLQSDGSLSLECLATRTGTAAADLSPVLAELVRDGTVLAGRFLPEPGTTRGETQYCWAASWARKLAVQTGGWLQQINAAVAAADTSGDLDIEGEAARAFHSFVTRIYQPPADKRLLVFFQCSVRRPFSSSPSHASMRRAVSVATGHDPARGFTRCPVHVVVLASTVGPVPYELEDVHPANVSSGGVKHFGDARYARAGPILARRMAEYVTAHAGCYDHVAAFAHGRYGDVLAEASRLCARPIAIYPGRHGPKIGRMGTSRPRTYWGKYWIQLYQDLAAHLGPGAQAKAAERLAKLDVEVEE